jgi:hypothetical protein
MGLKVYRLWVMGQLDSTCRAPPVVDDDVRHRAQPRVLHRPDAPTRRVLTPRGVRLVFHVRPELDLWVALHSRGCQIGVPWATRTRLMGCAHSRGVSDRLHVRPELDLWVALTPGGGVSDWLHGLAVIKCFDCKLTAKSFGDGEKKNESGFGKKYDNNESVF